MKKRFTALSTSILFGVVSAFSLPSATSAETTSLKGVQEERTGIQSEIKKTDQELLQVQVELTKLTEQIQRVDQAIIDNNKMIKDMELKVEASQKEISELEQEINTIQDRINKRNEILKKRALTLQESAGNVKYIDVILGSSSFEDFVGRLQAVAVLVQADQDLVKQYQEDQRAVLAKQASAEKKLKDFKELKTELEGMQEQILQQKEENDALKEQLKKLEQQKLSHKAELHQEEQTLASKEAELNQKVLTDPSDTVPAPSDTPIPTTSNKTINMVLHAGERFIGNSVYVFGGGRNDYDVAQGRFDCSGFVAWAFGEAGIKVGAHTDILKNTGKKVPFSEARPGDLVFFDTYKIDGHVGIYLGGGKFIGSQSRTGIAIADMTKGYYLEKFNGRVMRIIDN